MGGVLQIGALLLEFFLHAADAGAAGGFQFAGKFGDFLPEAVEGLSRF